MAPRTQTQNLQLAEQVVNPKVLTRGRTPRQWSVGANSNNEYSRLQERDENT